jgi:hypothetical protein
MVYGETALGIKINSSVAFWVYEAAPIPSLLSLPILTTPIPTLTLIPSPETVSKEETWSDSGELNYSLAIKSPCNNTSYKGAILVDFSLNIGKKSPTTPCPWVSYVIDASP